MLFMIITASTCKLILRVTIYCTTSKTSVHRPRAMYIQGTFLLNCELSDWAEGGNLPSWSKKQRAFSLQTYSCVSFCLFSTKKLYFAEKVTTFLIFQRDCDCIYQPFRLANLNKGHVCVTPTGDPLRIRLVPGPRHEK